MKWSEFCIHTTQEAIEPISNILHEAGASGVVIEDRADLFVERGDKYGELFQLSPDDYPEEGVFVKAYFLANRELDALIQSIVESINQLTKYDIDLGENKVTLHEVREEDWANAWKKYYHPVKVSPSITIKPTWEEYEKESDDEHVIELDPGMAFGTGTHPTTVLCIQALEKYVKENDEIVDVGTGSGVLSIASALLGAKNVLALDLDEIAVTSAKQNIKYNDVASKITVKQNDLLQGIETGFDIVVANILAEVILRFVSDASRVLKQNGLFISSGIISKKKDEVIDALENNHFEIVEVTELEDWVAIVAKKV